MIFDNLDELVGLPEFRLTTTVAAALCMKGEMTLLVNENRFSLKEGELIVVRHGQMVRSVVTSPDFKGFALLAPLQVLSPSMWSLSQVLNCFIFYKDKPVIALDEMRMDDLVSIHRILRARIDMLDSMPDEPLIRKTIETLALSVFYIILGAYSSGMDDRRSQSNTGRIDQLFYDFIRQIEQHYCTERRVKFYADLLHISPKHLSALSKELTGRTPAQWISSYVVVEAKRLLDSTPLTIQQISLTLNFPNQSVFGRYFKIHTGLTPKEYRHQEK